MKAADRDRQQEVGRRAGEDDRHALPRPRAPVGVGRERVPDLGETALAVTSASGESEADASAAPTRSSAERATL